MIGAFLVLLAFEFLGEVLRTLLQLPVPGPVIGMLLLALALVLRGGKSAQAGLPTPLDRTSATLLEYMGLLFVPAGAGIVMQAGLLRAEWLPIVAALIGSTLLSLVVTGLVMHRLIRPAKARIGAGRALRIAGMRNAP